MACEPYKGSFQPQVFVEPEMKSERGKTLVTAGYFALWYSLSVMYNIYNKKLLNVLPLPFTVAMAELYVFSIFF